MLMKNVNLSTQDFNHYLKLAKSDKSALDVLYPICLQIIKTYVINRYGYNNFYDNIPHDVFTRIVFDHPPDKYIKNPAGYLCKAARNYMYNVYTLKDNNTLELLDNYEYIPEYENSLEFNKESAEKAWYKLDKCSRYILYMTEILDYPLDEVAEILNKSYESVKSKKWRAKSDFKKYMNQIKKNTEVKL